MPLRIKVPSKEKIIINGAVIENAGEATTFVFHNRVDILRRKEVLSEEDAITPARRVYFSLQCAYLFDAERETYCERFADYLKEYIDAAPSAEEIGTEISALVAEERYYDALRAKQNLIEHETERLKKVGILPEDDDETPQPGESPA